MVTDKEKIEFSKRLNLLLDFAGVKPKGKGRQKDLSTMTGVGPKGVRKWLEGEATPSHKNMTAILAAFKSQNVTSEWLLYGNEDYAPDWVKSGGIQAHKAENKEKGGTLLSIDTDYQEKVLENDKNPSYQNGSEKDLSEVALGNSIQIPNIRFETAEIEIILSSQKQQGVELMNISSAEAPIEEWGPNTFGIRVNSLTYSALAAPGNTIIFDPDRSPGADDYVLASFVTDPDSDYEIMQYKKTGGTFELKTAREDIPVKMYTLDECAIRAVMIYVNFGGKSYL